MRLRYPIASTLILMLLFLPHPAAAQNNPPPDPIPERFSDMYPARDAGSFRLSTRVDEVSLTFHAAGADGLPVNDLKLSELRLFDNGIPPRRVVSFEPLQNLPIRAGILIDTSESMSGHLASARAIAIQLARRVLRHDLPQTADRAFVMDFGYTSRITQPWTRDEALLSAAISHIAAGQQNPLGGTALFDTLYRACFNQFAKADSASGNVILLFSDGEDNTSHMALKDVVDICQRSNTVLYAFRAEPKAAFSSGPKTLAELASETGGRVFFDDDPEATIDRELRAIEAELRNQYRLIYNPAQMPHDGASHRIDLHAPARVQTLQVRDGYYDSKR